MIHVDRGALPPEFMETWCAKADRATEEIIAQVGVLGPQQRLSFRDELWNELREPLMQLFHRKCATCESPLGDSPGGSPGDIEHFRPRGSVAEEPGLRGYYWLAYSWTNLYPICYVCDTNKRSHFPIADSETRACSPKGSLEHELPMLLDPCVDAPEEHLRFVVDGDQVGTVAPLTERGRVTIETLGLNRSYLITRRKAAIEEVKDALALLEKQGQADALWQETKALGRPSLPYAAARRAYLAQFGPRPGESPDVQPGAGQQQPGAKGVDPEQRTGGERRAGQAPERKEQAGAGGQTAAAGPSAPRTGYISRVAIQNFKAIESIDLRFNFARKERAGWQVFLGENGTGKSSILQAIGIALIGQQNLTALVGAGIDAQSILRRPADGAEAPASGSIRVWLGTDPDPIEVIFDREGIRYTSGAEGANIFVRGYGATRLPPRRRARRVRGAGTEVGAQPEGTPADAKRVIDNLLDPYVPLCDAATWLAGLDKPAFDKAAMTIKDVLRIGNEYCLGLDRSSGQVTALDNGGVPVALDTRGVPVPLDLLSHGQRSALALAADILSGITEYRRPLGQNAVPGDFRDSPGIVLLDEIDAHLHPRWKMEIVRSLKQAFPRIQFLSTTHEPLCLRGLDEEEIVIVQRDQDGVKAEVSPISPNGWRVDQLLTSELFGMFTTIDPDLDAEFQAYYRLLSKPEAELTEKEITRLAELRRKLRRHNRLGYTRRDQLLYEVIDEYLVQEVQTQSHEERKQLREGTKRRLRDIWERVIANREQRA